MQKYDKMMRGGKMRLFMKGKNSDFKYAKGESDIYGNTFHTCYEIFFLLSGNAEYISEKTRTEISPGHIVLIPPGGYHQFVVRDVENYERCVLNIFSFQGEDEIIRKAFEGKEIINPSGESRIKSNLFYLLECIKNLPEEEFSYICDAVATDIVFNIKNLSAQTELLPELLSPEITAVMEYINNHFKEQITTRMLSERFHISVSSLCHNFKENFGISIKKYILEKRMNAANMDLKNGINPEKVSEKYGFSNSSSFYRDYKRHFGVAPSKKAES